MSEVVKIVRGEIIPLKKDSPKVYDEFKVEKEGKAIGSRFTFKVQTRINDRVENSPRLFRRCSFFVKSGEEATKIRNLRLGVVLDVDGTTNRRSFKGTDGKTVWIDEVDVRGITIIQPATQTAVADDNDLPF